MCRGQGEHEPGTIGLNGDVHRVGPAHARRVAAFTGAQMVQMVDGTRQSQMRSGRIMSSPQE